MTLALVKIPDLQSPSLDEEFVYLTEEQPLSNSGFPPRLLGLDLETGVVIGHGNPFIGLFIRCAPFENPIYIRMMH